MIEGDIASTVDVDRASVLAVPVRGIECNDTGACSPDERKDWLAKLDSKAVRARADRQWQELDLVERLSEEAEGDLVAEARKHAVTRILRSIPGIGSHARRHDPWCGRHSSSHASACAGL